MTRLIYIRRRFFALAPLLGFGLIAFGAAQVSQSRSERTTACERAAASAMQWHRQVATELAPDRSGDWYQQASIEPLALLQAISVTGEQR